MTEWIERYLRRHVLGETSRPRPPQRRLREKTREGEGEMREWIVQRCTQQWLGTELVYEDWPGYSERLMTRAEMESALSECNRKWFKEEFRGHNAVLCRNPRHVHGAT